MIELEKIVHPREQINAGLVELAKSSRICGYQDFFDEFLPSWSYEDKCDKIKFFTKLQNLISIEYKKNNIFPTVLLNGNSGTPPWSFFEIAKKLTKIEDTIEYIDKDGEKQHRFEGQEFVKKETDVKDGTESKT